MLEQQLFRRDDVASVRALIRDSGWATMVSATHGNGLVTSHLPIIVDPDRDDDTILGHLAQADAAEHDLGAHDVVVIVAGPHGYVSPAFYDDGPHVPTWNFQVLHLHGTPEVLSAEDTYGVLERTVDHFESVRPHPWRLATVAGYAHRIAPYTVGFRLTPVRRVGKAKFSQDELAETVRHVIAALEDRSDVHANPGLAAAMRATLADPIPPAETAGEHRETRSA
jgi:transcriptional regulator